MCKSKECCCKCKYQVEIMKHPINTGMFKGKMDERIGYGCSYFMNDDTEVLKSVIFSESSHGLCEGFSNKNI